MSMTNNNGFGQWTTLEARLQELHDRLVQWNICTKDEYAEIWNKAYDNFNRALEAEPLPMESDRTMVLKAFEDALAVFDTIWLQAIELQHASQDIDFDETDS